MGIPAGLAQGSIVFSLGRDNTSEDIDFLVDEFPAVIKRLREISPYAQKGWGGREEGGECTVTK
jgi:cysteine desulfurase